MKKKIIVALVAALAIPFAGLTSLVRAQDTPDALTQGELNRMLRGTYSYMGSTSDESYDPAVGTLTFDGHGGLTGTMDINADGTVCVGMALSGTYVVAANRTATAALTLTSVDTSNCDNDGNGDTMALAMSFGVTAYGAPVKFVNFVDMDPYVIGTFAEDFYPFSAVATNH